MAEPRLQRLSPDECTRLLARTNLGRVSVSMSALPAIRTVRYTLTPGYVVFRAAPRSKLRDAAANTVVAFHTDSGGDADGVGWSVLVQGMCQEVTAPSLIDHLRRLPLPAWSSDQDVFFRLPLLHVSGERVYWA